MIRLLGKLVATARPASLVGDDYYRTCVKLKDYPVASEYQDKVSLYLLSL